MPDAGTVRPIACGRLARAGSLSVSAADGHDDPSPRHGSRVLAAQASGPCADVLGCRSARRTSSTRRRPRSGARRRCCSTSTRSGLVRRGRGVEQLRARGVRQRSALRRVVVYVGRARERVQERDGGNVQGLRGAGRRARSRWRHRSRSCRRAAASRWCAGCSSRSDTRSKSTPIVLDPQFPDWGTADTSSAPSERTSASRSAEPPLCAAPGAR